MPELVFTVTKLNEYVAEKLAKDFLLRNVSVRGEISGFKRHSSGHLYFTLKDSAATVQCVMFRQQAIQLAFVPKDGVHVVIHGHASLYTRDGKFQLYAEKMEEQGLGDLFRQFELYKEKLQELGYFDPAHKKKIPHLPRCVGIVTSSEGAALQDMLSVITRRYPKMNIEICPAKVQGTGAAQEITAAIQTLNRRGNADVLLVGRGGGSMEDLWAFNEPAVAKAIYDSRIPVISAVGHETDFTIADFVADLRAPTPSAAAELCVPEYMEAMQSVCSIQERLFRSALSGMQVKKSRVEVLQNDASFWQVKQSWERACQQTAELEEQLYSSVKAKLQSCRENLIQLNGQMTGTNPADVLRRGYAWVRDSSGSMVASASELQPGDRIELIFADGSAAAKIESTEVNG